MKSKATVWELLREQIGDYVDAAIEDSWKGGGDPTDRDVIEATFKLEEAKLSALIDKLEREFSLTHDPQ
jgi:hypothetical protein